jgi:hypothetical protein
MQNLSKHVGTRLRRLTTPQSEAIPGTNQLPNSAGGFAWTVSSFSAPMAERFTPVSAR